MSYFSKFATDKYRWHALVFIAIGLAIVIIDNTVLNVAIPYILRDLHTTLDAIQWVISGYALIIATLLIFMGRLGDVVGRKKIFLAGTVLFAIGSFIASIAKGSGILFLGEALIEAIGAAAMLTSSLSLLASEFRGRERAIAFGIWGSVAGASATIGPLLGGYFTTYHSWRWSLRINVIVAIIAILGSVFIQDSKGEAGKRFDWLGTVLSGLGFFALVFGVIEGRNYGWWHISKTFSVGSWIWPLHNISVIPFAFLLAAVLLIWFVLYEQRLEALGGAPVVRMSLLKNSGFSWGLISVAIMSLGQFGVFFILPIYLQNVLGLTALKTGVVFLSSSLMFMIFGPLSGFVASKINPKWVIVTGMAISCVGTFYLARILSTGSTGWSLAPALVVFGIGGGMSVAQITNVVLSVVPIEYAGEASALNNTLRQIGTSIGIAILGSVLASTTLASVRVNIQNDSNLPGFAKNQIAANLTDSAVESGQSQNYGNFSDDLLAKLSLKNDIDEALVKASKRSTDVALIFIVAGLAATLLLPRSETAHKD